MVIKQNGVLVSRNEEPKVKTVRERTLEAAIKCVTGSREQDYGSPEDNFDVIAGYWSTYLGTELASEDVAVMMALFKVGRITTAQGTPTEDTFVDLAGYAACAAEIADKRRRKA